MAAHSIYRIVDAFVFGRERRTSTISNDPNVSWMLVEIGETQVISTKIWWHFAFRGIMRVAKCQTNCYSHLSWIPKLFDYFSMLMLIGREHQRIILQSVVVGPTREFLFHFLNICMDVDGDVAKVVGAAEQFNWQLKTRRIDGKNISTQNNFMTQKKSTIRFAKVPATSSYAHNTRTHTLQQEAINYITQRLKSWRRAEFSSSIEPKMRETFNCEMRELFARCLRRNLREW